MEGGGGGTEVNVNADSNGTGGTPSTTYSPAFLKQNIHFQAAIQSLDLLKDQLNEYPLGSSSRKSGVGGGEEGQAVKTALTLMQGLILDTQEKFQKMVDENKGLGQRLDEELGTAQSQLASLRSELSQLSSAPSTPNQEVKGDLRFGPESEDERRILNGPTKESTPPPPVQSLDLEQLSLQELREELTRSLQENQELRGKVKELSSGSLPLQLSHAKEALSALKGDRKRLKAEKFELLSQMKELYVSLEEKEKELREFIRKYEQKMRESEAGMERLMAERDEAERERWTILRHARDEAERGLALATQLSLRETQVGQLQEELHEVKRQLSQFGLYSEPERSLTQRMSGGGGVSHYSGGSGGTPTYATVGDRGSSADSGVRLSSDRDSGAGGPGGSISGGGILHNHNNNTGGNSSDSPNEGGSLELGIGGEDGGDSISVISTATLPQLFHAQRDSPAPRLTFNSLSRSLDPGSLSRSAEQLLAAEAAEARRRNGRGSGGINRNNGPELPARSSTAGARAWGSISRVFSRNKHRRAMDPSLYDALHAGGGGRGRSSWSPEDSGLLDSPSKDGSGGGSSSYRDKLRALEEAATLPMELWRAGMVQAWLEISLGMPQYGSRCGENVKSGKVLLELSDNDLETELGIVHPLHRKKLRLAIEEHRNPVLLRYPPILELSHIWVSSEWLPDIGLPQYGETFAASLVDGRLLDHLSKKDLEKYLGVSRKFHLASIAHGVHLLRILGYNRQALAERRTQCEDDPLVWTNGHFLQWARSIDLKEYAENLKGSGVHGAFAVLEPSFSGDTLASAMGIPPSKQIIRRHLSTELEALLVPARGRVTQQYRVSRAKTSTLEAGGGGQFGGGGGDSLQQYHTLNQSEETNRRKPSLRFSTSWRNSQGSLSRALGLKLKADLLQRQKEDSKKAGSQFKPRTNGSSLAFSNSGFHIPTQGQGQQSQGEPFQWSPPTITQESPRSDGMGGMEEDKGQVEEIKDDPDDLEEKSVDEGSSSGSPPDEDPRPRPPSMTMTLPIKPQQSLSQSPVQTPV